MKNAKTRKGRTGTSELVLSWAEKSRTGAIWISCELVESVLSQSMTWLRLTDFNADYYNIAPVDLNPISLQSNHYIQLLYPMSLSNHYIQPLYPPTLHLSDHKIAILGNFSIPKVVQRPRDSSCWKNFPAPFFLIRHFFRLVPFPLTITLTTGVARRQGEVPEKRKKKGPWQWGGWWSEWTVWLSANKALVVMDWLMILSNDRASFHDSKNKPSKFWQR